MNQKKLKKLEKKLLIQTGEDEIKLINDQINATKIKIDTYNIHHEEKNQQRSHYKSEVNELKENECIIVIIFL